jgi:ribulose bisphosphate carboxylase small subunit
MGIEAVHMSAGELESPDAGDSARLIRLRYREAAELVKVRGRMAVLMINDIDAGAGRVDQYTQYTVNTQLVNGTLMNIADNPTSVQLPGSYEIEPIQRIPIIVTGNDFSTLYAPLIRDGRMEKFFWEPNHDDRIGIVSGIFEADGVMRSEIEKLVNTFPEQAIDFYGALRSRLYDEQVFQFIQSIGLERISMRVVNSAESPPEFRQPDFSLPHLIALGNQLVQEQKRVQEMRLAEEYNKSLYFNRKLGNIIDSTPTALGGSSSTTSFYRAYEHHAHEPSLGVEENGKQSVKAATSYAGQPSSTRLSPEMVSSVNQVLNQGQYLGIEYVDERRFRTNSWQCFAIIQGNASEAIEKLETCLNEHPQEYIRLVGIDSKNRRRVLERIVQRPQDLLTPSEASKQRSQ